MVVLGSRARFTGWAGAPHARRVGRCGLGGVHCAGPHLRLCWAASPRRRPGFIALSWDRT